MLSTNFAGMFKCTVCTTKVSQLSTCTVAHASLLTTQIQKKVPSLEIALVLLNAFIIHSQKEKKAYADKSMGLHQS